MLPREALETLLGTDEKEDTSLVVSSGRDFSISPEFVT